MSLGYCFLARRSSYCGNAVVEPGEQCDCGTTYTCDVHDRCCTPLSLHPAPGGAGEAAACRLAAGSSCSPRVQRCCTPACGRAPDGVVCRPRADCSRPAVCDGRSSSCPAPRLLVDGTACGPGGRGQCRAGRCSLSACGRAGLVQCQCRRPLNHACSVCCRCPAAPPEVCLC